MPDGKKLTLPLRTLLDTAETLNNASNSLNTSLQAVEDQLNAANIGLEVWLEAPAQRLESIRDRWEMDERDRRTFTELGLTSLVDGRDCYICTELGYARTGEGWHLAVREWSDREHLLALTRRVQLFEQLLGRLAGSYQDIRVLRRAVLCDWLTVPLLRNQEETAHLQRMLQGTLQHYGDILQEARCEWDESRHCYRMVFVTRGSTTTFTTVVDDALLISNEIRNLRTLARQFEEFGEMNPSDSIHKHGGEGVFTRAPYPLAQASRRHRIAALRLLPALLQALQAEAAQAIKTIEDAKSLVVC